MHQAASRCRPQQASAQLGQRQVVAAARSQTFLQPPQAAATQRALGRRLGLWVVANTQRSNSTTKKRTTGPPTLPPINDNGSGGGGGWDGHKIARNLALNAFFLGIYFLVDSGGPGGIFNGGNGGGGGGGGGWGGGGGGGGGGGSNNLGNPGTPQLTVRELDYESEDDSSRRKKTKRRSARDRRLAAA